MKKQSSLRFMTQAALCAALIAVIAPLSVPIGPVPISLATWMVYLCAAALGWKKALAGTALYILLGAVGLPVYAGYTAGVDKLVGSTGGYFLGYLLIALCCGLAADLFRNRAGFTLIGMLVGTALCYLVGTLWLAHVANLSFLAALSAGVLPFLLGDALKIATALPLATLLRRRLEASGVL